MSGEISPEVLGGFLIPLYGIILYNSVTLAQIKTRCEERYKPKAR